MSAVARELPMRSSDVGQGCDSRSRDRQGRPVAASDRNCASSGFLRRTCARLRHGRSPASDSRGFPRGSGASRARAARADDEAAKIEGEAMVRPGRRLMAFAALGSVATLLLSAAHTAPQYAVGSMAPSGQAAPSIEAPSPGSQSTGAPATSSAARAADGSGYVRAARTVGRSGGRGHDAA
jgi:hypothetical protein